MLNFFDLDFFNFSRPLSYDRWVQEDSKNFSEVAEKLAAKDGAGALKAASKMHFIDNRDICLLEIINKVEDLKLMETAADQINSFRQRDWAYQKIATKKIDAKDSEGALNTAIKISSYEGKDSTLVEIVTKVDDLKVLEKASSKMRYKNSYDIASEKIIERKIAAKDVDGAAKRAYTMYNPQKRDNALMGLIKHVNLASGIYLVTRISEANQQKAIDLVVNAQKAPVTKSEETPKPVLLTEKKIENVKSRKFGVVEYAYIATAIAYVGLVGLSHLRGVTIGLPSGYYFH